MSLLMDALKKAERTKGGGRVEPDSGASIVAEQQPTTGQPPPPPGQPVWSRLTTAREVPGQAGQSGGSQTPDEEDVEKDTSLPKRRRADAWPAAPGVLKPPGAAAPSDSLNRKAAQSALAARQPAPDRMPAVVAGAIVLVLIAAIGVYFWLRLMPESRSPYAAATSAPPATAAGAAPAGHPAQMPGAMATLDPEPVAPRPAPRVRPNQASAPAPAAEPDSAIRITTSHPTADPALLDAYQAFQTGNLAQARTAYERLLHDDPRNADALRGAAAVALREGRGGDARAFYQRLVEADPRDATAQAGLAGLDVESEPVALENRLKSLLAGQPDAAPLHFALANLYARQGRWNEAQQAYFQAVTGDGNNPDYLFNLAVSLDQIHQPKPAAQYYRQALAAAAARPASFDPARAAARLRELQP